jgi:hypothetical protein
LSLRAKTRPDYICFPMRASYRIRQVFSKPFAGRD